MDQDLADGKPIVIHVTVALCDNVNQGIIPVPSHLGHGQDPKSNLYWGALYGVRTHLSRTAGWQRLQVAQPGGPILERCLFFQTLARGDKAVPVTIVADAWDGAHIKDAITRYLEHCAGAVPESIEVASKHLSLEAGGASHVLAYIGHNGLMEFDVSSQPSKDNLARGAIALACMSRLYFEELIPASHTLLLTNGLMAPEAYTLDAAIRACVQGAESEQIVLAAATAYHKYQKCGMTAAKNLFVKPK